MLKKTFPNRERHDVLSLALQTVFVSQYLRQRSPFILILKVRSLRKIQRQWLAFSRSLNWSQLGKMTGLGIGIFGLWIWQWQLLVAIALGTGTMAAIYLSDRLPWEKYLEEGYRLWQSRYRRLFLAGFGGALSVLISYGVIALWQSIGNPWLTSALVLQGGLTSLIFALILRRIWQFSSPLHQFERALADLGDPSTVRRLYAIRQLQSLLQRDYLTPEQKQSLKIFLQLSWQQETVQPLREALLNNLRLCQLPQAARVQPLQLDKSRPPLKLTRHKSPLKSIEKERV
jgi:hypothetical protein